MSTPGLTGLLETSLYVTDLERAAAFYQMVLGCEVLYADRRMVALDVGPGQVLLLFVQGGSAGPTATPGGTIPPHDGRGNLHLAFSIPAQALGAWERRLARLDIDVEERVTWSRGGTSLYFRDPDRHVVELATPGLWANY